MKFLVLKKMQVIQTSEKLTRNWHYNFILIKTEHLAVQKLSKVSYLMYKASCWIELLYI